MFRFAHPSPGENLRGQLVIAPHHPDRLRRPAARAGAIDREHSIQALVWNSFRTLELLPPAFWLRRLHARLIGEALRPAPQIVSVHLWHRLEVPSVLRLDGARADVAVDVVIETEHAVWTLVTGGHSSRLFEDGDSDSGDVVSRIIDAGGWRAGRRQHYVGVIEMDDRSAGQLLVQRLRRSNASVQLRSSMADASATVAGVGAIRWTDLASILSECEQSDLLSPIERALARNGLSWLERVGVQPAMSAVS